MGKLIKKLKKRAKGKVPVRRTLKTVCPKCGQMTAQVTVALGRVAAYCPNCDKSFSGEIEKISESMRRKMQRQLKDVPGGAGGKCTNTIIRWHNWEDGENDGEGDKGES